VIETHLGPGESEELGKVGASIVLATKGSATVRAGGKSFELKEGNVYFVSQQVELAIKAKDEGLLMYAAYI
jgi:mannose-6-phosphate isomerase